MRSRLPPLDQLHAFALVAQSGSLTAAAAALNVTQPAVSRRLRELEAALGVALLRRGANAVALTEAGAAYAAELSRGFAVISAATEALSRRPAPPIRIRAYTTWAMRWLIPRLPAFQAQHPGLSVEVLTSMRPQVDFLREGIDAAIRAAPENAPPMPGAIPLQRVLVAPFAAPALARAATADGLPRRASRCSAAGRVRATGRCGPLREGCPPRHPRRRCSRPPRSPCRRRSRGSAW